MEEKMLSYLDFGDLNGFLYSVLEGHRIGVEDLIEELMTGDVSAFRELLVDYVHDAFFGNLEQCRNLFLAVMLLGIFAILLNSMSDLFSSSRITWFSDYFIFMFGSLLLLNYFAASYETATGLLEEMGELIGGLLPVFCIALGMSNGTITAAAHYELELLLLFLVEKLLVGVLLPLVQVYSMMHVLNQLPEGNRFGGMITLLKKAVVFVTRAALFASIGGSMLQAALLPAVDGLKNQLFMKTVSLFPGLGDYADAIGTIILQSAGLVKNSVGIAGIFVLLLLCIRPVLETFMYGCMIRLASALLQISGEKKFTGHIWKMADSFFLLARVQLFGGGIFMVSIAVATVAFYRR